MSKSSPPTIEGLSPDQQMAMDAVMDWKNVFITGPAGTGKSYLINKLISVMRHTRGDSVAVTASTGISSMHVNGATIHSWLGLGIRGNLQQMRQAVQQNKIRLDKVRARVLRANVLIVDEVSMLSGDYIEMMDEYLKFIRQPSIVPSKQKPFGGLQMIFCGDLLQLPPVSNNEGPRLEYEQCFMAPAWKSAKIVPVNLTTVFRQEDREFIGHLMKIREGIASDDTCKYFNKNVVKLRRHPDDDSLTVLCTTNKKASRRNEAKLAELPGKEAGFTADLEGPDWAKEKIASLCIAEVNLRLKIGAPVLILANNIEMGIRNGMRATVLKMSRHGVTVRTERDMEVTLESYTWEYRYGGEEPIATLCQYPIKLAWAITIHKSQGLSISKLHCDISDCFADGQAYVALSRAENFDNLTLESVMTRRSVRANQKALEYYEQFQEDDDE